MRATIKAMQRACAYLVLFLDFFACGDLPYIVPNVCGNGVVERGEDCDSYGPDGTYCLPVGAGIEKECRFGCSEFVDPATDKPIKPHCPDDKSCGTDGICRRGTGKYTRWGDFVAVQAHSLQLGDLDGDGRDDLLALGNPSGRWDSHPRVLFFDLEGHAEPALDPLTPLNSLTIARLTVDKTESTQQQIVGGTLFGLATLAANSAHEISSVPYPFQTNPYGEAYRMIRLHGVADQALGEQILIHADDGTLASAESQMVVGSLGLPLGQLIGDPVPANIVEGAESQCEELVFTLVGDRHVYAYSVCGPDNRLRSPVDLPHPIALLPEEHTVKTPPILANVDDDSHIDLVVGDEQEYAYVAFGRGDGTFTADRSAEGAADGSLWPVLTKLTNDPSAVPINVHYPLTIGDLNQDGHPDWVLPNVVALVKEIAPDYGRQCILGDPILANGPSGGQWDFATIADMNGDGRLDLVAGSTGASILDYFAGTGLDVLNGLTIPTRGKAQQIITGDYDGNLIDDVALIQRLPMDPSDPATLPYSLAIAFSKRDEGPTSVVEVARFSSVSQLLSGNYQANDAIEEIGVLAQSEVDNTLQLTLFLGNRTQRPIASLGLWRTNLDNQRVTATPIATSVLNREKPSILTLAADDCGSNDCHVGIWYTAGTGSERLSNPVYVGSIPPEAQIQRRSTYEFTARFAIGDLDARDASTREDAWLLTMNRDETHVMLWRVALPPSDGSGPEPEQPLDLVSSTPGSLTSSSLPKLIDLDGDRWRDLVVLFTDTSTRQHLLVLWNEDGNFDFERATAVDVASDSVNDFAVFGTLPSEHLYVTSDHGIFEVVSDKHRSIVIDTSSSFLFASDTEGALPGAEAIAVGDMTGDGLPDLAVSLPGGVRLYAQEPSKP